MTWVSRLTPVNLYSWSSRSQPPERPRRRHSLKRLGEQGQRTGPFLDFWSTADARFPPIADIRRYIDTAVVRSLTALTFIWLLAGCRLTRPDQDNFTLQTGGSSVGPFAATLSSKLGTTAQV
jgi:hypothetical protein